MPRDVIPFRAGPNRASRTIEVRPNIAFAALDLFRRMAGLLAEARPFRDACRELERRSNAWGVPPTFFLGTAAMGERPATRPNFIEDRYAVIAARQCPNGAAAWAALGDLLDDGFTACAAETDVRRVARAVPNLRERLAEFAGDHRGCAEFAALLDVADDFVVTVVHPAAGAGFRVRLTGIADLDQFHILLADAVIGSPVRGYLAGTRPDARLVDACLDRPADAEMNVATARFQFLRPAALEATGTLPGGFAGTDHWIWGHESPRAIPISNGERVLLIGDAAYARQWIVRRRFPALNGGMELLNVLNPEQIGLWIEKLTGTNRLDRGERRAA